MESVYIESTVISYYTARRTRDLIAAARVRKAIGNINEDRGLVTTVICTPEELMEP